MREVRLTTTRRARYHVLEGEGPTTDVWIVCHGFGQLAAPFLASCQALVAPGRAVVAPEALSRFYVKEGTAGSRDDAVVGATWMTKEDRGHEIADYVEFLDRVHADVVPDGTDVRVTGMGFSQGVATVCRWVERGQARVDRLVLWAGSMPPDVRYTALRRVGGGVTLVSGTRDQYANWVSLDAMERAMGDAGLAVTRHAFEGGHRLDDATLRAISG